MWWTRKILLVKSKKLLNVNSIALDNNCILLWENTLNQTAAAPSKYNHPQIAEGSFFFPFESSLLVTF